MDSKTVTINKRAERVTPADQTSTLRGKSPDKHTSTRTTPAGRTVCHEQESRAASPFSSPTQANQQDKFTSDRNKTNISGRKIGDTPPPNNNLNSGNIFIKIAGELDKRKDIPQEKATLVRNLELAEMGDITFDQLIKYTDSIGAGGAIRKQVNLKIKHQPVANDRYSKLHSKSKKEISEYQRQTKLHFSQLNLKEIFEGVTDPKSLLPTLPILGTPDPHHSSYELLKSEKQVKKILDEIKKKSDIHTSKELKKVTFFLSNRLSRSEIHVLSDLDKDNIRTWFFTVVKFYRDIESWIKEHQFYTAEILKDSVFIFQQALTNSNSLIHPELIAYTLLPTLLTSLNHIVSRRSTPKQIRSVLRPLISQLCICFNESDCASIERLRKARMGVYRIHLKSMLETSIPSRRSIDLITLLIREENNPQDLLSLIKMIVNFHDISDFCDKTYLQDIIEHLPDPELVKALNAILADEEITLNNSMNTNILWIRATQATQNRNFTSAEQLLQLAAKQDDHMGLELALFYLDHWPNPDKSQIRNIYNALLLAEKAISELDQYLWQQCMAKVSSYALLTESDDSDDSDDSDNKEERQARLTKTESNPNFKPSKEATTARNLPHSSLSSPISSSSPLSAPELTSNENDSCVNLTSVINTVKGIIKKYQIIHPISTHDLEIDVTQFKVVGWKNRTFSTFEAMMPSSRNPRINKLIWYIHRCRTLNNLEQEILCYKILTNEDLRYALHFERLLEELVWTLLHCLNDPQHCGFEVSKAEQLRALDLARELMLVCIEYTIKPHGIVTKGKSLSVIFNEIESWLNNIKHFNNNPELQQHMQHTLRCRAGSSLGHIYSFKASLTKRREMEEKAAFCFQAKTRFDPNYEKEKSINLRQKALHPLQSTSIWVNPTY